MAKIRIAVVAAVVSVGLGAAAALPASAAYEIGGTPDAYEIGSTPDGQTW